MLPVIAPAGFGSQRERAICEASRWGLSSGKSRSDGAGVKSGLAACKTLASTEKIAADSQTPRQTKMILTTCAACAAPRTYD